MNIILVSQCSKKALTETRRILDQFAERCGDRTWQTSITNQGLETLYRLLRKTARKNTAVACRWVRGRNHTELIWIVGDRSKFNDKGAVPTNTTKRDILRSASENNWHTLKITELLIRLAALFHDFGKSCDDFQKKLKLPLDKKREKNLIRHEWISIRIFTAFVGNSDDRDWLQKLADKNIDDGWREILIRDGLDRDTAPMFKSASPLVKLICWLIVSHHMMPLKKGLNTRHYDRLPDIINAEWCRSEVKNTDPVKEYWDLPDITPFDSEVWLKTVSKVADEILQLPNLDAYNYFDPYTVTISREVLMLSDHIYSSLKDKKDRLKGDKKFPLYANTDRATGELNQTLDEHLIGLEKYAKRIMHSLPYIKNLLPSITKHKSFKKRNFIEKYKWQDKAYDLACSIREKTAEAGCFGINMASTGCGKTIANGRIVYGLSNPETGARFTIALGLRTLTLQTGDTYRNMLNLRSESLAVLVGGGPVKDLYGLKQDDVFRSSESESDILPVDSYVHFEGNLDETPFSRWFKSKPDIAKLLNAPVAVCTVDHIIPVSEGIAGGHQLAPLMRLMTGDLVLDEPDDFDVNDLYALSRLVYYAGLCGSRVLLSSATITPAIAEGLFRAYEAGRKEFNINRCSEPLKGVCCVWFDENGCFADVSVTSSDFADKHKNQVAGRVKFLEKQPPKVRAEILSIDGDSIAERILTGVVNLHNSNCQKDKLTGANVSFGIVRIANINQLVALVREFAGISKPDSCIFHICCYHSKFPLALRSKMERALDKILNRGEGNDILSDSLVRRYLQKNKEKQDHIFIVFASPVAEVGRDHDYDWAVAEPSSMRSIIQLGGRIRRHRSGKYEITNMLILDKNIKAYKNRNICYEKPGFESEDFKLKYKSMTELLRYEEYVNINSIPRIVKNENFEPEEKLADLEHFRLQSVMMRGDSRKVDSADLFWETPVWLSGCMQMTKRFRDSPVEQEYVCRYDIDDETEQFYLFDKGEVTSSVSEEFKKIDIDLNNLDFFINMEYGEIIEDLADSFNMSVEDCSLKFGRFTLIKDENNNRRHLYNSYLGVFAE